MNEEIMMPEDITVKHEYTFSNVITRAKPSPYLPSINYGTPNSVPAMPGLLAPYFHGLIEADYQFIPRVIGDYFLRSLGENKDRAIAAYKSIKGGHSTWVQTKEGLELAHIVQGMKLAIVTQTRLFVILEQGTYNGFVLLGAGFTVYMHDRKYRPDDVDDLQEHLSNLTSHRRALSEICEMLSKIRIEATASLQVIDPARVEGARVLHREIAIRKKNITGDEKVQIEKLGIDLAFPEHYLKPTVKHVQEMIALVVSEDVPQLSSPMYLPVDRFFSDDHFFIVMSQFGANAPSFRTTGGDEFKIPKLGEEDSLSAMIEIGKDKKKVKVMSDIRVSMKVLNVAISDFRTLLNTKSISFKPKERAGMVRQIVFGGAERDELWTTLRTHIGAYQPPKKQKITKDDQEALDDGESVEGGDNDALFNVGF